jgi:hypothetical protein
VRDEWTARLPEETGALFRASEARFETCYGMLSVVLDEALGLRAKGDLCRASAEAGICGELFANLAGRLVGALNALESHTRHFGTQPTVAPLEPTSFRGETCRRSSAWNSVLHRVLFSSRSRWFHKLQTLREIIVDLDAGFGAVAEELSESAAIDPAGAWASLEAMHDDLNTCLRELVVMLKCFLRALPEDQVAVFRSCVEPATSVQYFGESWPAPWRQIGGTAGGRGSSKMP